MGVPKLDQTDPIPPDLIDATAAAQLGKCHLATIYRWVLSGKLPGWRRAGRIFVSRVGVLRMFRPIRTRKEIQAAERTERRRRKHNAERVQTWAEKVLTEAGIL